MDIRRRFEADYRVRFDEADADGLLRPSGFLRYAQDMAWRHSEQVGFGRDWYAERSLHWLVRNVTLEIRAPVTYGDTLTVSTEIIGRRHVWVRRHAEMRRTAGPTAPADGALVANVDTDWVLLTLEGQPARVPSEITALFAAAPTFERSRLTLAATPKDATRLRTRVRPQDTDPMGHLNNAAYLDLVGEAMASSAAGQDGRPAGRYRVGYVRPALPGAPIEVAFWPAADVSLACRISDGEGEELTRVLLSRPMD